MRRKTNINNILYNWKTFTKCFSLALLVMFANQSHSQKTSDTLSLDIQKLEKRFIDSNFLLLAAHYNVDAQKALIEQAKVWQNPTINTDFMMGADGKFFNYGKYDDGKGGHFIGQYYVQIQQLILTAGKRGKLINMATTNAKLSELQMQDVLRNLRYQLHQDYYNLTQQLALLQLYTEQEFQLNKLLSGMKAELGVGNIAQKDLVRIQALSIALQQDKTDLEKSIADTQYDLKTLLQIKDTKTFIKPTGDSSATNLPQDGLDKLINQALQSNPNYILQQTTTTYQQQNLAYQKSLRSPDLTLGPNFDRNSNYAPNYVGMGLSLPLPVFNKNQGNIKSAQFNIKQQQAVTQNAETELVNNVSNAYEKLVLTVKQNSSSQQSFYNQYEVIYNNMLDSYRKREINLLEFLDFYNDYNSSQQRLLQQKLNLHLAEEELKYQIGK